MKDDITTTKNREKENPEINKLYTLDQKNDEASSLIFLNPNECQREQTEKANPLLHPAFLELADLKITDKLIREKEQQVLTIIRETIHEIQNNKVTAPKDEEALEDLRYDEIKKACPEMAGLFVRKEKK